MLDYHLHLWPHGEKPRQATVDELGAYCERAAAQGVEEIALTEHFFRFTQARDVVGRYWESDPNVHLHDDVERYWDEHVGADLDHYVETVLAAKDAGLPVVLGLEVDYYPNLMDRVVHLLAGYPFDVLLGSVHWLGAWMFDDIDSPVAMAEWDARSVDEAWKAYAVAMEELAATQSCDVLAHPDLVKVTGRRVPVPDEFHDRLVDAAVTSGMAAEVSSAGWRKPVHEAYPAPDLLHRFRAAGVPITTASDAHTLPDVADRAADLRTLVTAAGYDSLTAFRGRQPVAVGL